MRKKKNDLPEHFAIFTKMTKSGRPSVVAVTPVFPNNHSITVELTGVVDFEVIDEKEFRKRYNAEPPELANGWVTFGPKQIK